MLRLAQDDKKNGGGGPNFFWGPWLIRKYTSEKQIVSPIMKHVGLKQVTKLGRWEEHYFKLRYMTPSSCGGAAPAPPPKEKLCMHPMGQLRPVRHPLQ